MGFEVSQNQKKKNMFNCGKLLWAQQYNLCCILSWKEVQSLVNGIHLESNLCFLCFLLGLLKFRNWRIGAVRLYELDMNSTDQTPQKLELEFELKLKNEIFFNTSIQQGHIKLIKSSSKDFYVIKTVMLFFWTFY